MKPADKNQDWDNYYKETKIEELPWFTKNIDSDLAGEIKTRDLKSGRFLDLGTGDGTQARALAELGFDVTGTDVSQTAINNAKKLTPEITFLVDDIMDSKLGPKSFDYIFDRGVFHLFDEQFRKQFARKIKQILDDDGIYFLKCMSIEQEEFTEGGPNRLSKQEVLNAFSDDFDFEKIEPSGFESVNFDSELKAWFAVLKKT